MSHLGMDCTTDDPEVIPSLSPKVVEYRTQSYTVLSMNDTAKPPSKMCARY